MATSGEQYELFLTLAGPCIAAAKAALDETDARLRQVQAERCLVPLAVDAALLGAEGLRELSLAITRSSASINQLAAALDELEHATIELSHGDESGARTDESRLRQLAKELGVAATPGARLSPVAAPLAEATSDDDSVWQPSLAEDMLAAFLDECVERTDSLTERLLRLEQNADDRELVSEIFRDLHTLKGSSAFAGLTKMNRVAHKAEDLIGALREGRRQRSTARSSICCSKRSTPCARSSPAPAPANASTSTSAT